MSAYSRSVAPVGTHTPPSKKFVVATSPTARLAVAVIPVHGVSDADSRITSELSLKVPLVATTYVDPLGETRVTAPVAPSTAAAFGSLLAYVGTPVRRLLY